MRNETLIDRISQMSYEDLQAKIRRIRSARVDAKAASQNKPTRQSRPKKDKLDTLLKGMSDEEKAKLLAQLESGNEG